MQCVWLKGPPLTAATDLLVVAVRSKDWKKNSVVKQLDKQLGGALMQAAKRERFVGRKGQLLRLPAVGLSASQVSIAGVADDLDSQGAFHLGGKVTKHAEKLGASKVVVVLPDAQDEAALEALVRGLYVGNYRFVRYLADKGHAPVVKRVSLAGSAAPKGFAALCKRAQVVAQSVRLARDLVNTPGYDLYPESFAKIAQKEAKAAGVSVTVYSPAQLKKKKMNLLLGVGAGSSRPPRLVHLRCGPSNSKKKPIVLVGKGITFDSGGLSLKPPSSMESMKIDMGGAAAVLGTILAVAKLKPKVPVHGLLALAENMPGGRAIRPGDVITGAAGRSVEINNTDAEGRLVLADTLHFATTLKPARIVDMATLTGAIMVALGQHTTGLFSNQDALAEEMLRCAKEAGEDFWHMPLNEALRDGLKSDVADTKNTGPRFGGAITAALFLKDFTKDLPWVHLDIAGPAATSKETGAFSKGGTGVPIATLVRMVMGA